MRLSRQRRFGRLHRPVSGRRHSQGMGSHL